MLDVILLWGGVFFFGDFRIKMVLAVVLEFCFKFLFELGRGAPAWNTLLL